MSSGNRKRPPGQQSGWGGKNWRRTQHGIEPGSVGYLFTCDGHEKQAVTEAYNLINRLLDAQDGSAKAEGAKADDAKKVGQMGSVERLAQLIPQPEVADGDDRNNEQFVVRGRLDAFDGRFHGAGRSETPPHRPFAFRGVIDDVSNDPTIPKSSSAGGRGRPVVATVADGGVDGKRVNITIAINIRCRDRNNADDKVAHQAEDAVKQSSPSSHREQPKCNSTQPAQKEPSDIAQQAPNTDVYAQRDLSLEPSAHSLMSEYADGAMQSGSIRDQPQCFNDQEAAKQPSKIDQETAKGDADVTPQPSVYSSTDHIRPRPRSDQLLNGTSGGREFSSPSASRASTSNATDGRSSLSLKSSTKESTATHAAFSSDRTDANHQQKSPSGRRWGSREEPRPPIIPSRNHRLRSTSFQPIPQTSNLASTHRRLSAFAPLIDLASSTFEDVRYIDDADAEQLTLVDGGPHQRWSSATASNGGDGGVFQIPIYHRAKMPRRQSTTGDTSEREVEAGELGGSLADRSSSASSDDDDDNNNNTINKNNNNDHQRDSSPASGQYARRSSPRSKDTFTLSNKNDSPHRIDDEVFEEAPPGADAEVDDGWPTTVDDSAASESDRHLLRNVFDYDKNEVGLLVTPQPNGDTMLQKLWWEDDEDEDEDDEDDEDDSRLVSLPTATTQHPLSVEGVTSEGRLTTEGASVAEEMPAGDLIATSSETARKKGNRMKRSGHMRRSAEATAVDDEEDIADALKRECAESVRPGRRRLLQRPTGAKNTIFVASTAGEDKCEIARRLVKEVQEDGESVCRFLMRILPVEVTCKFYLDDVSKAAAQLISKHFANVDPPPSYAVMYKSRNQDKLSRKDAIDIVTEAVRGVSPLSKVNLADPDKAVIIEATRTIVCMSVVTDFAKLRKYSLQPPSKEGGAGEGKGDKDDKEDKEEEDKEQNDNEEEGDASGDEATDEKADD
uniref:THUMP domain-containing protein n=1 Tax=Plectus sambesii TaxID=2011161 RepID=A0A914XAM7_9BILA